MTRPSFGSKTCWRDAQGIHFTDEDGASDCAHTITRPLVPEFLEGLDLPEGMTFHAWLRTLDRWGWEALHWQIQAAADDNFVWIGTDEIEKWGR